MAIVDGSLQLGYKDNAWFTANASLVLLVGQIVYLEQTGTYKLGDGVTQLSALSFLGLSAETQTLQAVTDLGANTTNQMQINGVNVATVNDIPSLSGYVDTAGLTTNYIPKATASDTIGDSSIEDDGTLVTVNGGFYATNGSADVSVQGTSAYMSADQQSNTNIESNLLGNEFTHNVKNTFNAPANNFPQLTASQSVETDASKNLVSVYKPFVTPEMYGAVGDGVTDDYLAITNAVNSGKMVVFGAKNYRVNTAIILSGNKTILGSGALTVISTTSNISVFSITGSNNTVSNLTIQGNNTGTSQNGISAVGNVGFTLYYLNNIISECLFKNLGGSGIYATNIIGSSSGNKHEGTYKINSCIFESCNYGINFAVRGEYNNVNNCAISSCTTGISITGGNNSVNGGKITDCTVGFELLNGANDGHSVANGVMINHNTTNISSSSLASGYLFEGCMIYAGNLSLLNSAGLYFSSCFFGNSMTITSTSNTNTRFTNCNFVSSFTLTLTGTQPLFNTCKFSSQPSNVLNIGGDKVDISATSTVVGWSATTGKLIKYWASGKSLFVSFDIDGTSNSTTTNITIPFGQSGATSTAKVTSIYAVNNGTVISTGGAAQINGVSTTVNFFTSMGLGVWTASGTKRVMGLITIELEN